MVQILRMKIVETKNCDRRFVFGLQTSTKEQSDDTVAAAKTNGDYFNAQNSNVKTAVIVI